MYKKSRIDFILSVKVWKKLKRRAGKPFLVCVLKCLGRRFF